MTRFEFFPEQVEKLLDTATLSTYLVFEVGATWMRIFGGFAVLEFVDFGVDLLDAAGEGWGAQEGVDHAPLE